MQNDDFLKRGVFFFFLVAVESSCLTCCFKIFVCSVGVRAGGFEGNGT